VYTPKQFQPGSDADCLDFVRANPFGILATHSTDSPRIETTHTPFLLSEDGSVLTGHIARANPHWKSWQAGGTTLAKCLFHGPHAYISPRYYATEFNVPTWNYTAVDLSGRLHIEDSAEQCLKFLSELTERFEPGEAGWKFDTGDQRYSKLADAIVVFSIEVESIEGKFKLNQNKSRGDQESVIAHLVGSGHHADQEVASLMEENLNNQSC